MESQSSIVDQENAQTVEDVSEAAVLHFLFPTGSGPGGIDEMFLDQQAALAACGFTSSLCGDSVLAGIRPLRGVPAGSNVVYRGWMATADEYAALVRAIGQCDASPFTSLDHYLATHHMPNWYPLVSDLTPETRTYPPDVNIESELLALGWNAYFLKDFVKSLKTSRGSIVHDPAEAPAVIAELQEYRGRIEGGICVRRVEEFEPGSERRFFVLRGVPYGPSRTDRAPVIVQLCAERIPSLFFSVDVVQRRDGQPRVVEIGDGQVSDLVGWSADAFAEMWLKVA